MKVPDFTKKPKLSFWQIWNMNFGFLGLQFSFALQQTNMSTIFKQLGGDENVAIYWLAGPMTGLLVQPIIGVVSDGTWSPRWGRRKPFFLIGALLASVALILMPYSSQLWMAVALLWILDAANNVALEPYRAFVSDKLPKEQHSFGFLSQSFFTGLGSTIANFTPAILIGLGWIAMTDTMGNGIPKTTYWAFMIGAFFSIVTVLITVFTTKEYPPSDEELKKLKEDKSAGSKFVKVWKDLKQAFVEMPKTMKQLIPVKFFTWFAMFCYWQYFTAGLSSSLFNTVDEQTELYKTAQILTGQVNGTYNIVCFVLAFALVPLAKKIGIKGVHFISLLIGGTALLCLPLYDYNTELFRIPNVFGNGTISISNVYLISFGLGISWASMLSMPYSMLTQVIKREKTGVYMGIFNMFIVIPMLIEIFSMDLFLYDLLGRNPINVVLLAGVFLILGGVFTLFVSVKDPVEN